jgi:hypothetical protein
VDLFLYVSAHAPEPDAIQIFHTSASRCWGLENTLEVLCNPGVQGSTATLEGVNCSDNAALEWGSCLRLSQHFLLLMGFWAVTDGRSANSLIFSQNIQSHRIWCLRLVNNSCKSDAVVPGLIFTQRPITIANSIFQANRFDFFIGTTVSASVTLEGCVIDFSHCNTTGTIWFVTTECLVTAYVTDGLCPFQTTTPTISMSPTEAPSHPATAQRGLRLPIVVAIGISALVAGAIVALPIVCALLAMQRRGQDGWRLGPEVPDVPGVLHPMLPPTG